ncbi:MAG TPA: hypothetical protein VII34_04065 [Pyrinomonadaceae bacterium]
MSSIRLIVRREASICNSPDRQVGVTIGIKTNEARRADIHDIHAGPSDLANRSNIPSHDLTVVAIE